MPWPESLSTVDQTLIQNWTDQGFRPGTLLLARAIINFANVVMTSYLASQSGLTSTFAAPAADSIMGILATLNTADIVPISVQIPTGYPMAQSLTVGTLITDMAGVNALLTTYNVPAAYQAWSNIVGALNL